MSAAEKRAGPDNHMQTDVNRCAVCGWPLAENPNKGCVRGNCSMRPFPDKAYDPKRANAENLTNRWEPLPQPSPPPTPRNIKCECGMTYAPRCPECGKFNIPEPSPPPEFAPCVPSLQRKCETEKMSDFERDYPWGGVESPDSTTGLGNQRLSSGNISQGGTDDVKPSPRLTCEPSPPSAAPPGRVRCHVAPENADIEQNKVKEPLGERIRAELVDWLNRNGIVSVMLDTEEHCVSVDIVKLPPRIKPVLTLWGSIYVRDDARVAPQPAPNAPICPKCNSGEIGEAVDGRNVCWQCIELFHAPSPDERSQVVEREKS